MGELATAFRALETTSTNPCDASLPALGAVVLPCARLEHTSPNVQSSGTAAERDVEMKVCRTIS